ncbi:hypothetical protein [Algoriphagus boritolerans]|uniref:hypothetical protein n=1 Tax=Algoriphagus boritolerans TaxID=308111 RepID=UPI000AB8AABC
MKILVNNLFIKQKNVDLFLSKSKVNVFFGWVIIAGFIFSSGTLNGQSNSNGEQKVLNAKEQDYYSIVDIPIPDGIELEVGGLAITPDGSLGVSTRRGEVWIIENPYMEGTRIPHFNRFAYGLHEPLGLAFHKGSFYSTQRSEITKLTDINADGRADAYETVVSWPLSGNYHEYSYGPCLPREETC